MTRQGTEIKKYYIEFNTGVDRLEVVGTLDDAKKEADECAAYTQCNIQIFDDRGKIIAMRKWWNTAFDPELFDDGADADIIDYGSFGYYDEWFDY